MKQLVWVSAVILALGGAAVVLLRTNQAPLQLETDPAPVAEEAAPAPEEPAAAEKKSLSTEEFRALGAEVMRSLPTKDSLKNLSEEEAHGLPPTIILAGRQLGAIAEAVQQDSSLEGEAFLLYETCAASSQFPDSVRALCFFNYRKLGLKLGKPVSKKVAPAAIRDLAEKIGE